MKKLYFAIAVVCFLSVAAMAQKAPNFGGKWTLDVSKSKLGDRNTIESQAVTVTQTDKDIKIETATKRMAPPAGGGGMGRMGGGGDMPVTYMLDGKESKTEMTMGPNTVPVVLKATVDGGKLLLSRTSTFNGPNGEMTMTTKETWELSADGKTLTINTERTTPRGTDTTTRVFTKS